MRSVSVGPPVENKYRGEQIHAPPRLACIFLPPRSLPGDKSPLVLTRGNLKCGTWGVSKSGLSLAPLSTLRVPVNGGGGWRERTSQTTRDKMFSLSSSLLPDKEGRTAGTKAGPN